MAFWWVNHKQTVRLEMEGDYILPPKHNGNGVSNATTTTWRAARWLMCCLVMPTQGLAGFV